jgi:hypothetical protein
MTSRISGRAAALVCVAFTGFGGAAVSAAGAKPAPRGTSCANPWRVSYVHGKVVGDTRRVALTVKLKGRQITVAWHAPKGYTFCGITLVEGRGQIFRSVNPATSYTYTDVTPNHTNGIKSLTATTRTGH